MLLSAENLSINFGSRQLLTDVKFYLNEGDKTGIIGINGTGKSTFLKVLAGAVEPDEGTVTLDPNVQISYLSQNPDMQDDATVLEQVFLHFPEEFRALNEYEAKSMLNRLGITDHTKKVGTLSGGMPLMVLLMCTVHASMQLSPTHVCLAVAAEDFGVTLGQLIRRTLPLSLIFLALMLAYYHLLLFLVG